MKKVGIMSMQRIANYGSFLQAYGSIFAIITHRSFSTLIRNSVGNSYGNEEKIRDLLNRLNLVDRMTTEIKEVENINKKTINYKKVDNILQKQRRIAKEYLRKKIIDSGAKAYEC